jgi:hypothetical protein
MTALRRPLFQLVGPLALVIAAFLVFLLLSSRNDTWGPQPKDEDRKLVEDGQTIQIDRNSRELPPSQVASRIVIASGTIQLPADSTWVADSIEMNSDTVLRGRNISIVARQIRGGNIDVSGSSGAEPGESGANGGTVFIAAFSVEALAISANGGDGAAGVVGLRGKDGRGGRCKNFSFRRGGPGGPGQKGGAGGNGGDGGKILLRLGHEPKLELQANGGEPGIGGPGGPGGRGGKGCAGLSGSDANRADGIQGTDGIPGVAGNSIPLENRPISYIVIYNTVRTGSDPNSVVALLKSSN